MVKGIVQANPTHFAAALRRKGTGQFWEGLPRFRQPGNRYRAAALFQILSLPGIIKREKIDILHCHLNISWFNGLWLGWILSRSGLRVVFHEHDPNEINPTVYKQLLARIRRHGYVIAISEFVQARLVELGMPDDRIRLLPNFVTPELFAPREMPAVQARAGDFVVGFAGRLVPRKGWRYFLKAAKAIEEESVRFLLAGDGPDRAAVERKIERDDLADKVTLLGHVNDMSEFFGAIDVFLMPVSAEPMGLVQLEAQAAGVPVVAYNVPGINETLSERDAIMVEPGDIAATVAAIRSLQKQPELYSRLLAQGQENVKRFSIEEYMQRLDSIYQEALS